MIALKRACVLAALCVVANSSTVVRASKGVPSTTTSGEKEAEQKKENQEGANNTGDNKIPDGAKTDVNNDGEGDKEPYSDGCCYCCCTSGATDGNLDADEKAVNTGNGGCCYEAGCCGDNDQGAGTFCLPYRTEERCCCNASFGGRAACRCCMNSTDSCCSTCLCNPIVKWTLFITGTLAGAATSLIICAHLHICCKKTAEERGAKKGESNSEMLVNNSKFLAGKKDQYMNKAKQLVNKKEMPSLSSLSPVVKEKEENGCVKFLDAIGISVKNMDNETKLNIAIYGMAGLVLLCLFLSSCARWRRLRKLRKEREEKRAAAYRAAAVENSNKKGEKKTPARSNDGFIQPKLDYENGEYRQPQVSYMGI